MKRAFVLCLTLFVLHHVSAAQSSRHVVLISIDGLRPEMYQDSTWPTPNLQELMKLGSYARHMKSVFPAYTYPSHSSMVTGAYPATHQVCYNSPFAPLGSDGRWSWEASNIKARTIWDAAKEAGLTSASVEWPVSVGAPITWNLPEIWPVKDGDDRITEARKYATPGLVEDVEKNATGLLTKDNMNENYLGFDENAGRIAAYIFLKYKPNLMTLHFACVDGEEHDQGRDGDSVRLAVETDDKGIGDVLEAIERSGVKDSTTVIIVGDHGFSDFHEVLAPNVWLFQDSLTHDGANWGMKFQSAGGSAFLYLQNSADTSQLARLRLALNRVPDSLRAKFRIIEKPELIKMGADRNAVMALATYPGTIFGGRSRGPAFFPYKKGGGHHGYDPNQPEMYTGFIAAGAGVNKGMVIPELTVVDIGPIVMKLLGVGFEAPDGKVVEGLVK